MKSFYKCLIVILIIFLTGCASQRYHNNVVVPPTAATVLTADQRPFVWPLSGVLVQSFGSKEDGISLKGIVVEARGDGLVRAARSGTVVLVDEKLKGYGKTVILEHSQNFSTVYARNSEILVRLGQTVKQGETVAQVGKSGKGGKPQLYFEIRRNSKAEDPAPLLS